MDFSELLAKAFMPYRYFNFVRDEKELEGLLYNPWIEQNDVVYCLSNNTYYYLNEYEEDDMLYKQFLVLSVGDQHMEKPTFFHLLNIGDKLNLSDGKTGTVEDIKYSLKSKDATYIVSFEDTTKSEVMVSMVDSPQIKQGVAMQSLMLSSDFE